MDYPIVHCSTLIRQVASLASGLFQHPPPNRTKRRPALRYKYQTFSEHDKSVEESGPKYVSHVSPHSSQQDHWQESSNTASIADYADGARQSGLLRELQSCLGSSGAAYYQDRAAVWRHKAKYGSNKIITDSGAKSQG